MRARRGEDVEVTEEEEEDPSRIDDSVSQWYSTISRTPLLNQEQEIALAKRIEAGDEEARRQLIEANFRLVVGIARRYKGQAKTPSLADLIQEGNLGLITAVDRFDYRWETKFSTFAVPAITQKIRRAVYKEKETIWIPYWLQDRIYLLQKTIKELSEELERRPTIEELATRMQISSGQVQELIQCLREPLSLNRPVASRRSSELHEFVPDKAALDPEVLAEAAWTRREIDRAISGLDEREALIIRLRFGLEDGNSHTLKEVSNMVQERLSGRKKELTRERIRQILNKALEKLRTPELAMRVCPEFKSLSPTP